MKKKDISNSTNAELLFTSRDLGLIAVREDIGIREFLNSCLDMIDNHPTMLHRSERKDRKRYIQQILYWIGYFSDSKNADADLLDIVQNQTDDSAMLDIDQMTANSLRINVFFKRTYFLLLYINKSGITRIKLRTLLKDYGFKRRSPQLIAYIEKCMKFYKLVATIKGGEPCNFSTIRLDDMIMFRFR